MSIPDLMAVLLPSGRRIILMASVGCKNFSTLVFQDDNGRFHGLSAEAS